MGQPRLLATGVLTLLVVLAGCGAPIAQAPTTTEAVGGNGTAAGTETAVGTGTAGSNGTASDGGAGNGSATETPPQINVTNGSLSVDPGQVFDRVQTLRGSNVSAPRVVQVFNSDEAFANQSAGLSGSTPEFYTLAGMRTGEVNITDSVTQQKNGYVTGLAAIVLYVGENATTVDELLLVAHEFTHYVQIQAGLQEEAIRALDGLSLTDQQYVLRSLLEGGAVVTTDAYLAAYADTTETNSEMYTTLQEALPDGHVAEYQNGQYVNGFQYMRNQSETPAGLAAVYENPPRTSEQVLHGLAPDEEPPVPLSVSVETGEEWVASGSDRMGEAFVRTALESTVDTATARRAAAGWGNDSLRFLRPSDGQGETSYAWVLRWDDAANQSEFASAYRDSLAARGTQTEGSWNLTDSELSARLVTPTDRTAVVVFGPESLTERVNVTGENGDVTVATAGS